MLYKQLYVKNGNWRIYAGFDEFDAMYVISNNIILERIYFTIRDKRFGNILRNILLKNSDKIRNFYRYFGTDDVRVEVSIEKFLVTIIDEGYEFLSVSNC